MCVLGGQHKHHWLELLYCMCLYKNCHLSMNRLGIGVYVATKSDQRHFS